MSKIEERRAILQQSRMDYALSKISEKGYQVTIEDETKISFERVKGKKVIMFPFTGWWSGKGIGSGRGIHNLLKLI